MTRIDPTPFGRAIPRVERWLLEPVDATWLVVLRVLLGLLLAVSLERFVAYGWIDEFLVGPRFHFKYWGFHWVEPLGRDAMYALFHGLIGLALATATGFCFRLAAPLLALGFSYIQLIDVSTYLNHYYLAALLAWLLALSPAARSGSLDAWWARRRGRPPEPVVARAWHLLFRGQVGVVYGFAGLAKLQSDWLLHGQPLGIWLGQSTSLPVLGPLFTLPGAALVLGWCGFLFDATIVFWLSWRRTRGWAYAVVLVFHTFTRLLFDIGMFPLIMSVAALVFFSADWPRTLARRLGFRRDGAQRVEARAIVANLPTRLALAFGALYCCFQLVLPLRFVAYPGNVLWHEQGMRFSWRVMVRAKGGTVTFVVIDPETNRRTEVEPRRLLTPFQENEMAGQPDLILQLAQFLGVDLARREGRHVEVHAETRVSLNGRRAQPLVDPRVDLTRVNDGISPFSWVLPAPNRMPPHLRPVQ